MSLILWKQHLIYYIYYILISCFIFVIIFHIFFQKAQQKCWFFFSQKISRTINLYNNKKINKEELIINTIDLLNKDNVSIKRRNIFNYISNLDIKISDQMIKVTLSKLIKNNYLTSENIGKNTQYKITNNFSQLIENIQNKIIKKRITPQSFVIILFVNLYIYKVVSNLCIKNN